MTAPKPTDISSRNIVSAVSSIFGQWCNATTYHGVPDFYRTKNLYIKTIWLLVVVTGCFLAFNQILDFILDFACEDQWATNYYRKTPSDDIMDWPDAAICYTNPMDAHDWSRNITDGAEYSYLANQENGLNFYRKYQADASEIFIPDRLDSIMMKAARNDVSVLDTYFDICRRTVVHCGANTGFTSQVGCNCSQFAMASSNRGCFAMNLTALQRSTNRGTGGGYETGVEFLLNPRTLDMHENVLYGDKLTAGLKIYINFNFEDNDRFSKPILVGSGMRTLISMVTEVHQSVVRSTHTFQFHQAKPDCIDRFTYKLLNTTHSSRTLCRQDCFTRFTTAHCHCVSRVSSVPLKFSFPICNESQEEKCQKDIKLSRITKSTIRTGYNLSHCFNDCGTPCQYRAIVTEISSAPFPVPRKLKAFTNYINRANIRDDVKYSEDEVNEMIFVELFFESKEYKVIERVIRISLEDLISNIGGTLGVWTGLSLIGIFQAFMYVLYCLRAIVVVGTRT